MNEIRIKSGIEITVNEKGETICINAEDQTFLDKFYGLLDKFSEAEAHMKSEKVRAAGNDCPDKGDYEGNRRAVLGRSLQKGIW